MDHGFYTHMTRDQISLASAALRPLLHTRNGDLFAKVIVWEDVFCCAALGDVISDNASDNPCRYVVKIASGSSPTTMNRA